METVFFFFASGFAVMPFVFHLVSFNMDVIYKNGNKSESALSIDGVGSMCC